MKKNIFFLFIIGMSLHTGLSQNPEIKGDAFAHTYSIVARDSITGEMAVGVQSHWFSVGSIVSWGRSGVGVVATQSFVNPAYGPHGLDLMEKGKSARIALDELVAKDEGKAFRQVAFLDKKGNAAAFTGEKCVESAMHHVGENFSVQANMMLNDDVIPAMKKAFHENSSLPLAERVVKVLLAAEAAGGDIRGKQSAALIVVGPEKVANSWEEKKIDLRVDDHTEPLVELERLLTVARAYEFMNRGDVAMEENNVDEALKQYGKAEELFPENLEMRFWKAIALANSGRMKEALPVFKAIFEQDDNWRTMTSRLPASGLLNVTEAELNQIIK
ncbi:DUF1028 domain-containing protein [Antarcticibacterium arcticum]|uniref:DUF1028 domain-containing protein n=1 Tax=Antarcticibacterium arcticum TaxID=2585771 RepID=A0A5B8YQD2_9FLAO|nr:DUF1028 domain-containing protein [Antarcticibacterium arcticum]QED38596.1 DUF1028 domain-containing protein [Antarcticibacterium arcticum]